MIKDPKKVKNHRRSALNQQRRKKLKKSQNSNHEMGFDYKDLMEQNLTFPYENIRSSFKLSLKALINTPQVGFEPTTNRLTADCSTTELLRI